MLRDQIKKARFGRRLSQSALAKLAGLTASEISRIECGYRDVSPAEAGALAAALGLAPAELVPAPPSPSAPEGAGNAPPTAPVLPAAGPAGRPAGGDLDDPANFSELPDLGLLERGAMPREEFRARLSAALVRTTRILHTSKVPAAVWRAWREFERKVQGELRA